MEHLRHHKAPGYTPLVTFYLHGRTHIIRGDNITAAIRAIILTAGPEVFFTETDFIAQYLHMGGDVVLLLARLDMDTIRLLGRCRRDTMLRYLQTNANSLNQCMSVHMVQYGMYALIPPAHADL